ncbi:MAG: 4Fe-4S binding protein [Bacteroidales bacterium]|nr:4Fe-4S binding protein [Bacteroidales bacterium]
MKISTSVISKLSQITFLLIVILLICIISINRDNKLLGISLENNVTKNCDSSIIYQNNSTIINTTNIISGIKGFGGETHLEIIINSEGKIEDVKPLKNSESPRFFKSLKDNGLFSGWKGLTPDEALTKDVDAISGATISSKAVIKTFNSAMEYVIGNKIVKSSTLKEYFTLKNILAILTIIIAVIVPVFAKNRIFRYIQLAINIIVLGIYCGTLLSLSMIVNFISNGFDNIDILIPLILIIVAFIFPLFGKKQYYCSWICPYGSSQEIINSISPFKIKISHRVNAFLKTIQKILWCIIMTMLCFGLYFNIMDYEAPSIFILSQTSIVVVIIGFAFLILSLFVKRPYCKYICPTGYLLKFAEKDKYNSKAKKQEY